MQHQKLFYATLTLSDGRRFSNILGDRSKRGAEQAVALLALQHLGIYEEDSKKKYVQNGFVKEYCPTVTTSLVESEMSCATVDP